jgi:DUF438 domain-containing protein
VRWVWKQLNRIVCYFTVEVDFLSLQFDFGSLNLTQLNSILNIVPVEITFIDENDTVAYFNNPQKMIFLRTKQVIGRKVQNCHPAKSVDTVTKII